MLKYKELYYRPETYDKSIIDEQNCYSKLLMDKRIILDLGGNIGAFARFAFINGAKKVISIEPDPDNFEMLVKNRFSKNHILINAAAVSSATWQREVILYKNTGINKGAHSLYIKRGRDIIIVPTVHILNIIKRYKVTCMKIDIEGGEYNILQDVIPESIVSLTVEFHFGKKVWRNKLFEQICNKLIEQNFSFIKKPINTGKNWHTLGVFER